MADDVIIRTDGLKKSFGKVEALKGVDLAVEQGTVFGLLGPNGAGKTTTIRILTTLLEPDEGTAVVAGLHVVRDAVLLRPVIGLAGQFAAVDENLTGLENLEMVGRLYPRRTPAGCGAGSTWERASSVSPRSSSWTSPRPASIHEAASCCGS